MDDLELLQAYADRQDQQAFAQLVSRHGGWLYSAARRQLADGHLAEDVTQAVFWLLSRRAKALRNHTALSVWLFVTLGYCIKETKRHRARIQRREQEVANMQPSNVPDATWEDIAPLLETLVARLGKADQHAVLLRFYEQKPLAEVGRLMGVSEEAARKRVDRAVEKLRGMLQKQGVTGTSAGLSAVLVGNVVQEVPARVVEAVMSAIGGGGSVVAGGIAKGAMKMMSVAKLNVVVAAVAGAVLIAGAAAVPLVRAAETPAETNAAPAARLTTSALPTTRAAVAIDQEVKDLVPLVQAGEARLLGDLEIEYSLEYRDLGKPKDPQTIQTMEKTVHGILQGHQSCVQEDLVTLAGGQRRATTDFRCYDGRFSRFYVVSEGAKGPIEWAITDRYLPDPSPRTDLPEPYGAFGNSPRMSQILTDGASSMPNTVQHLRRIADDSYLDQSCIRVQATVENMKLEAIAGPITMTWWLCPNAGHLPLRMTTEAKTRDGRNLRLSIESANLKQVAPGFLLPMEITVTLADPSIGGTHRHFTLDTLSLSPAYPAEKFVLAPPPGATLMVLHNKKTLAKAPMDGKWTPVAAEAMLHEAIAKDAATTRP